MISPPDTQAQVQELRRRLQSLLDAAHANERKLDRFDALERRLVAVSSMEELVNLLLVDCRAEFGLDAAELWLLDPDDELRRSLPTLPMTKAPRLLDGHGPLKEMFGAARTTRLIGPGPHSGLLDGAFEPDAGVRSAALLPLIRQGLLIGSLHLGSRDPERYDASSGTKFLDRLAAIAAIAIESMLNRERLRRAGMTDGLTGVHNRRHFDERFLSETRRAQRTRSPLAVVLADVDHFKRYNDALGHLAGDDCLRRVAAALRACLRRPTDLLARYGGEEFICLLPDTDLAGAIGVAQQMEDGLRALALPHPGIAGIVTVSLGVSAAAQGQGLVEAADKALYLAKAAGRGRVSWVEG